MEQRFGPALDELWKLFEGASASLQIPIRFALIGGLAVSAWGVVRATQDIDLLAGSDPSPLSNLTFRRQLQKFLEQQGCTAEWRVGDPDDPIPLLLHLGLPSPPALVADVLWAHKRWHTEALSRRITLRISRLETSVLHPEDLILMKLDAAGPQDLLDVQALLSSPPPELDLSSLRRKAVRLHLAEELDRRLPHKRRK